jgi:hypothetical protein
MFSQHDPIYYVDCYGRPKLDLIAQNHSQLQFNAIPQRQLNRIRIMYDLPRPT